MEISQILLDQINKGNVVLFLGAGASIGAIHPNNKKIPTGDQLVKKISEQFLNGTCNDKSLQYVSELAVSETDLYTFQKFIYDEFKDFTPAHHHEILRTFKWAAIVTTNYDLIIESVYNQNNNPLQSLVTFKKNGERIDDRLTVHNSLLYYKLHGCLTEIADENLPLILTPDQYITHQKNRSRLFERVKELSYEHPFLFVGYSLADLDIRSMLNHLDMSVDTRPRSYMVGPEISDIESRMWEKKKISSVKMKFDDFLNHADGYTNRELRKLTFFKDDVSTHVISNRFINQETKIKTSDSLNAFLEFDALYLHPNLAVENSSPRDFYKGYFSNWSPIINNYDIDRNIKDAILSEVVIQDENDRLSNQEFYLINGSAGSGKTVLLKRLAWDSTQIFDKLCLFLNSDVPLKYEPIEELYSLCQERIFLFIDNISEYIEDIKYVFKRANRAKLPLTIISAERINVWNTDCKELEALLTRDYTLKYLNDNEVVALVDKLEEHNSLGFLSDKPKTERINALSEIYGRELLVALHEATLGKPFEDIIYDEYNSISDLNAQSLYLTICVLHRLGAQTRAGLISRAHNISFTDFEQNLFKKLESIVFTKRNYTINDYLYQSRHQYIAEIVFERVLTNVGSRYDEYIRIISCLDVDYESDRHAFAGMTNARKLLEIFKNPELIRGIYKLAHERAPENPKLLQQEAIFEMLAAGGSIDKSFKLLTEAYDLNPKDPVVAHSLAEVYVRKSEKASNNVSKDKYLEEAKKLCNKIISKGEGSHAYHTLIKLNLNQLRNLSENSDASSIERLIKDTEKIINESRIAYPDQSFLLEVEAKFNEMLSDNPKALSALTKAFDINKRSTFIALRLANFYEKTGDVGKALNTLRESIEVNQSDKDLNLKYALLISDQPNPVWTDIKHYLRKSFTQGDTRFEAQFWYARCLYILNDIQVAKGIFEILKDARMDNYIKKQIKGVLKEDNQVKIFNGVILNVESTFGFVKRDISGDTLIFFKNGEINQSWIKLKKYQRVRFKIEFNFRGAVATGMTLA